VARHCGNGRQMRPGESLELLRHHPHRLPRRHRRAASCEAPPRPGNRGRNGCGRRGPPRGRAARGRGLYRPRRESSVLRMACTIAADASAATPTGVAESSIQSLFMALDVPPCYACRQPVRVGGA
jgi:hypothetical protein